MILKYHDNEHYLQWGAWCLTLDYCDDYDGDYFDNDNDDYYPAADGVYTVWYVPYAQEAADVPAEMFFTHPKSGVVDHISFTIPAGAPLAYTPVADITKTTDSDGNMSYEITAR